MNLQSDVISSSVLQLTSLPTKRIGMSRDKQIKKTCLVLPDWLWRSESWSCPAKKLFLSSSLTDSLEWWSCPVFPNSERPHLKVWSQCELCPDWRQFPPCLQTVYPDVLLTRSVTDSGELSRHCENLHQIWPADIPEQEVCLDDWQAGKCHIFVLLGGLWQDPILHQTCKANLSLTLQVKQSLK